MEDTIVIETRLGQLRGRTAVSALTNEKYYSFRGIPYAKPPLGELRFKAPEPFWSWDGIRDALEDGRDPKQRVMLRLPGMDPNKESDGDEDCLYLCVYTNKLTGDGPKRPVMVNIHGGGFAGGSGGSKAVGPDYFMGADIVLVSFNYRCGAFGFLSLENEEVPGNAGLKDQTMALRWVRDNIESFGGDPNNVTIFGVSAGGASVHFHLLSPLSKGLFHRAIIQSGFSQNPWALQLSAKRVALKLAKILGCTSEDPHQVLQFLQSAESDDIVNATKEFAADKDHIMLMGLVFSPCVEVTGCGRFLPDNPNNLMKRGDYNKVPTIFGLCENEGSIFSLFAMINQTGFQALPNAVKKYPELLVPPTFGVNPESEEHKAIQEAVKDFYFNGNDMSIDDFSSILKFESDYLFNIGFGETRKLMLADSSTPAYTYLFTNHSKCYCQMFAAMRGSDDPLLEFVAKRETCHGTDCVYLFRMSNGLPMPELTDDYKEAISKHVRIWTTFALTGNPTVEELGVRWIKDSESKPCYMNIGADWLMKEGVPFADRLNFWDQLSSTYCQN